MVDGAINDFLIGQEINGSHDMSPALGRRTPSRDRGGRLIPVLSTEPRGEISTAGD
jgi:hypothetical protein